MMATEHFPLDGEPGNSQMAVAEVRAKIVLRGRSDDMAFAAAAQSALGFALPTKTGTAAQSAANDIAITALCLAPDEWMLWAADNKRTALLGRLRESLGDVFGAAVDVSDYYLVIKLNGDNADDILASGCPLDLAQVQLANAHKVITGKRRFSSTATAIPTKAKAILPFADYTTRHLPHSAAMPKSRQFENAATNKTPY